MVIINKNASVVFVVIMACLSVCSFGFAFFIHVRLLLKTYHSTCSHGEGGGRGGLRVIIEMSRLFLSRLGVH